MKCARYGATQAMPAGADLPERSHWARVLVMWLAASCTMAACGGSEPFETPPTPEPAPVESTPPDLAGPLADPLRGARLFANVPAAGQLGCIDCHSNDPIVKNFGNIFVGRNAPFLIQRAVANNTGGMGSLGKYYGDADLADIAAYLGNSPGSLDFAATGLGASSPVQSVTVRSSTKAAVVDLSITLHGDFSRTGGSCADAVARFSSCTVDIVFRPVATGTRTGSLLIRHADAPDPILITLTGNGSPKAAAAGAGHLGQASLAVRRHG